jgi:hypothetical protein
MVFRDLSHALGLVGFMGQIAVCVLAFRRGLWRRLPWFTAYVLLVFVVESARWGVLLYKGEGSVAHAWTYWMTQPLLLLARAFAIADICRAILGLYTGVWQLARCLLGIALAVMLALAAVRTAASPGIASYILFVERELEFAVVVVLLMLLVLSRYYDVVLHPPLGGLSIGFALYSSVVTISSSILIGPFALPWTAVSEARTASYLAALGIWIYALRAPLPIPVQPQLSTVESYERNSRVVTDRMRELNARLMDLMKR